jgi:transposase
MKGYVAVQKKLLTLCYALWKNDTAYDATYYTQQAKKIVPTSGTTQDQSAVAELSFG